MIILGDEAQVEARFGPFGDSANWRKIGAWFAVNIAQAQKSFRTHQMELLSDMGHVESRFGPFWDSISVGARKVHGLQQTYHRLRYRFGRTWWYS
jgi:hypothetical protein